MTTLFSYTVRYDDGFAPNPFHGVCTLACCKPRIRKAAKVGDYVVGFSTKGRGNRVVYAMRVTETMEFGDYWVASRFLVKRPDMSAGGEKALGDNIYYPGPGVDGWVMEWSQHSNPNGSQNVEHTRTDISGVKALISDDFVYWGDDGERLPDHLSGLVHGRGHKSRANDPLIPAFVKWFEGQPRGRLGWPTTPLPKPMPKPTGAGKQRKKC